MLALLVAATLAQAPVVAPPPSDAPVQNAAPTLSPPPPPVMPEEPVPELRPNKFGRKPGFFSSPQVTPGILVGRVAMGGVLGSVLGGGLAAGFLGLGVLFTAVGGGVLAMLIAAPFAIAALGVGTALGSAMFGEDYGRDLADAVVVALLCSLVSVAAAIAVFFLSPSSLVLAIAAIAGVTFPAIATPLLVQAFKKGDAPEPTLALARF